MATHSGDEGIVKVGSNVVAEVRSYNLTKTAETRDDTVMGDTDKTFIIGKKAWTVSIECFWDETDTSGQQALVEGASVSLKLYPEGDTSGDTFQSGTGLVTEKTITADQDGIIEASITVQGTGSLTETTV